MRKSSSILEVPTCEHAIFGISETHLTQPGIKKFKSELHCTESKFQFYPGAPAPHRSAALTSIGGTHVGTGFITTQPARNLQPLWTQDQWNQARFTMSTFLHNEIWISGAVVYAYAAQANTTKVRQQTDELLTVATERIVRNMTGCRFIMGDFNQLHGSLTQTCLWENLGWKEVQCLHQERNGCPILATCKQRTTKDFIWISPEMQQHLRTVEVVDNLFPDHSALVAHFWPFGKAETIYKWRKPKAIPWDQIKGPLPEGQFVLDLDKPPAEICQDFAKEFESRVNNHLSNQGKSGLQPCQVGRCQTLQPCQIRLHSKPLKPSRSGEQAPLFHGQSLSHQRLFTQLRRLVSLTRLIRHDPLTPSQRTHAEREWRAILKAPGFDKGFCNWWQRIPNKPEGCPPKLPRDVPTLSDLLLIHRITDREVREYETVLQQELRTKAVNARIANPHKIFKDFAKPTTAPVRVLDHSKHAQVVAIDESDCSMILDHNPQFHEGSLSGSQGNFMPIHVCDDQVWVEEKDLLPEGSRITQHEIIGHLPDMFKKFGDEWVAKWDKHRDTPDSHWDPLLDFIATAIPEFAPPPEEPITYECWTKTLKSKRKRTAVGPDGLSRLDLLHLPRDLTEQLLRWFHAIENGHHQWPEQWLTGIVHCLEKTADSCQVSHYRPITVLSMAFRTWSSMRARQALQILKDRVPGTCYGSIPGRSAAQMWMGVQCEMESAAENGTECSGVVLDIQKCFNHIPRLPTLAVLIRLGLPAGTIRAWTKALHQLTRRFSIRKSIGPALPSSSGFAEGCSLSVVAMIGINYLVDKWTRLKVSQAQVWSFVDNLEITTSSASATMRSFTAMETILKVLELPIDYKKTYLWGNSTEARKFFQQTHQVKKSCRDLGGQMQYTRAAANSAICNKIKQFQPRWQDLAMSHAPYPQKVMALKTVAWPNTLHGIASTHLGDQHYDGLRTAALQALRESKPGTSPMVHLSLCESPMSDPGCYALITTVCQFRQCISPDYAIPILHRLSLAPIRVKPEVGPCSVLLHRLRKILWTWDPRGFLTDQDDCPIQLWECPIQELKTRLLEAWQIHVSTTTASRKSFAGMEHTCASLTTERLPANAKDRAIILTALNGTFFTANHLKHRDPEASDSCHLCGAQDSIYHRNWECEALQDARAHLSQDDRSILLSMHPATYNHGWMPLPPSVSIFRKMLQQQPIPEHLHPFPFIPHHLHVFTDGSCENPTDPFTRICSWGVVVADPRDMWQFHAIASGVLPGRCQSIVRAEMLAVHEALVYIWQMQCSATVWIDNQGVLKAAQLALDHPEKVWTSKTRNHDLLNSITTLIHNVKTQGITFCKVSSHQDQSLAEEAAERWAFHGNDCADTVAGQALATDMALMNQWRRVCQEIQEMRRLRDNLHKMILGVGNISVVKVAKVLSLEPVTHFRPRRVEMQPWEFPIPLPPEASHFQVPETDQILAWIRDLHQGEGDPVRWSWWELFVDANLQFQQCGPWYCHQEHKWKGASCQPAVPFLKRVRSFSQYLTKLAKCLQHTLPTKLACPVGSQISFWTTTLPVVIPQSRIVAVDQWLGRWISGAGRTSDLRAIP